jgi:hypothetical protein
LILTSAAILVADVSDRDPYDLDQQELDDDLRRTAVKLDSEADDADFAWLMSGPRGRRFVRRLLERARVFQTSFHPNTMQMSLQEGEKQMGYWILGMIERLCPEDYHTMMQEKRSA